MSVRRFASLLLLSATVCLSPVVSQAVDSADAMVVNPQGKPLMLVRFNQPRVAFERQLYAVVQRAVEIKPDVIFDVIAYVPESSGDSRGGGAKVVESLRGMGIPSQRIAFREVPSSGINDTEVHVYVR